MSKSDGGKGSSPRPFSVSQEEYDKRWDAIFQRDEVTGRDLKEEEQEILEEDSDLDELRCPQCGGVDTMYITQTGFHSVCDQCGYREKIEPDYD